LKIKEFENEDIETEEVR